ncbi:MAG: response regulator [Lachnospiraceae bacterium]|nr:response regulator [Lachnospiraceae bacterium]
MIKVVIADDEVRICQLIDALVDWKKQDMEVVGTAHNGLEALDMVRTLQPDILITDIRMPGCSGLELVGQAKERVPELEIIIVSGYAHFEYAQQAIRYGVGDYLLKPVNKAEMTMTLEKLKLRILQRKENRLGQMEMKRKTEKDRELLQANLIDAILAQKAEKLTEEELRNTYGLRVGPGLFQAFIMKMDCGREEMGQTSISLLMDKAKETLELELREKCTELLPELRGLVCAGFLNYAEDRQEDIRRAFKSAINQLELQKSLFRPVSFSVALGSAGTSPEKLQASMKEASLLIEERLLQGTGRLFERLQEPSGLGQKGILEQYLREMSHAVEVKSMELLEDCLCAFSERILSIKDVRGYELLEAVYSAAEMFAIKSKIPDRTACLNEFHRQCGRCSSAEEIFSCLKELETGCLSGQIRELEEESIRPIRKAKQYIQEHYSEPITQEEVSSAVGLSSTYFSTLFKKTDGEGFARYLMGIRMEQARTLLRETNLPVAEICRRVGYNDLKHFTKTFEKAAGVKPSVYRKLYG